MCFGSIEAPEPIEIEKPVFVRNPFLDDEDTKARSADALRRGRQSLVIPTGTGIGFEGAGGSSAQSAGGAGGPGRSGPRTIGGGNGTQAPQRPRDTQGGGRGFTGSPIDLR